MRERFFIQTNLHTLKVILEQRDRLVTTMAKENLNLKSQAQDAMVRMITFRFAVSDQSFIQTYEKQLHDIVGVGWGGIFKMCK